MGGVPLNVFNELDFLEPKCPSCNNKLEYDVNTRFSTSKNSHVCIECNTELKD